MLNLACFKNLYIKHFSSSEEENMMPNKKNISYHQRRKNKPEKNPKETFLVSHF